MFEYLRQMDNLSRRSFLEYAAQSMLGVTALPGVTALAAAGKPAPKAAKSPAKGGSKPTAKNVIFLYMGGGMTHIDTFDPKPGRDVQGETQPIQTKIPGVQFGDFLPKLAGMSDKLAVIRSLFTETGDHEQGKYLMRTSYKEIATIRHPGMGAWAMMIQGRRNTTLPDNVLIGNDARHPGQGFLEPVFSPLPIGDPLAGLQNTAQPKYVTEAIFEKRMRLIDAFDSTFRKKYEQKQVEAYNEFYTQAIQLMSSDDLKVFDLKEEKDSVRDEYGRDRFGQGCLMARRLVENNVRFVEVIMGGWDQHNDIRERMEGTAGVLDTAVSALLKDLESKGLLEETMVVLGTEFGRSPKINQNTGRDHHPGVFSGFMAGGGIKGGRTYGTSDEDGHSPDENPVSVGDYNATIAHALGLPLDKEFISPSKRPFTVTNHHMPITAIL